LPLDEGPGTKVDVHRADGLAAITAQRADHLARQGVDQPGWPWISAWGPGDGRGLEGLPGLGGVLAVELGDLLAPEGGEELLQ